MIRTLLRIFRFLVLGTATLILSACYGVVNFYSKRIEVRVCDKNSKNPIQGLKVTFYENGEEIYHDYTAINTGSVSFVWYGTSENVSLSCTIEDVDGDKNGTYTTCSNISFLLDI